MPVYSRGKLAPLPRIIVVICLIMISFSGKGQSSDKALVEKNELLIETSRSLFDTDTKTAVSLARMAVKNAEALSDSEKFNALITLGAALIKFDNYPEAEQCLKAARKMALKLEDERSQALVSMQLGTLEQQRGRLYLSVEYLNSAKQVFTSLSAQSELAKTLISLGNAFHFQGKNNEALEQVSEAYEIRQKYGLADTTACLVNMGIFYVELGQYPTALKLYLDALAVYESRDDEYNISQVHSNLGILYKMTNEFDKAELYYKQALTTQEKLGHRRKAHYSHNNLGLLYFEQGKTEAALKHLQKALDEVKAIGSYQAYWAPLLNLGYYHNEAGNHETAIEFLLQAYTTSDTTNNINGKALSSIHLASVYNTIGRFDLAKKYGAEGIELSGEYGNLPTLEYALYVVQTIYKSHGEYEEALRVYDRFVSVKDSIMNAQKTEQIARLETRYELAQKEREIETLGQKQKELELNEKVSKLQIGILIAVLAIIISFGFYYFKTQKARLREHQLQNRILHGEVTSITKQVAAKNQMLDDLKAQLEVLKNAKPTEGNASFLSLFKLIESNSKSETEWSSFVELFNTLHPLFFSRLEKAYPDLSNTELRLAALIKLRLSLKEIAEVVNITPASVKQARYRLKKKLDLAQEQDLAKFLYEF